MSDYAPRTEDVRSDATQLMNEDDFDRWLNAVKAEAWEEGHEAAAMRIPEGVWHDTASPRPINPYRKGQNA